LRFARLLIALALSSATTPAWALSPEVAAEVEAVVGPWRIPEPADNCFADLVAAVDLVANDDAAADVLNGIDAPAVAEEVVAANAEALAAIRAALGRECRIPPVTSFDEPFPYLAKARQAARVFCVEGRCLEARGDVGGALSSYIDAIRLGRAAARGGCLIHGLVYAATTQIACRELSRVCKAVPDAPDGVWGGAIDALARIEEAGPSGAHFFASELSFGVAALEDLAAHPEKLSQVDGEAAKLAITAPMDTDAEARALCEYAGRTIELCSVPYRDGVGVAQPPDSAVTPLAGLMAPATDRAMERFCRHTALLRGTRVLLAIARFRQSQGVYPQTLAELVPGCLPAAVEDPYTREGFLYGETPNGLALYSPGANGLDDDADEERDVVIGVLPD